jgi:hypothetical protein
MMLAKWPLKLTPQDELATSPNAAFDAAGATSARAMKTMK